MLSTKEIKKSINFLWNEGYPEYMLGVAESILTTHLNLNNCKYKQLTGTGNSGNIKIRLARND